IPKHSHTLSLHLHRSPFLPVLQPFPCVLLPLSDHLPYLTRQRTRPAPAKLQKVKLHTSSFSFPHIPIASVRIVPISTKGAKGISSFNSIFLRSSITML